MFEATENKVVNSEKNMLSGAEIFLESLKKEGVKEIFGYPGGVILSIYDVLYNQNDIKHYLVRHEQAAIHAAEGYAKTTGNVGVALVTSGPGATNAVTGIADAYLDGVPIVVFTGQVHSDLIGNDAFQEADMVGITSHCCKHNYLVKNVKDLPRVIKEAFHIANTGKPGPVVIDMPKDVLANKTNFKYPEKINLPGYNPNYDGHPIQILKALSLLYKAERPAIICGGGVIPANAMEEVKKIAMLFNIPVVSTLMGLGAFPADNPLFLGMVGMHGTYAANKTIADCDVLLAIGTRFSDRVTGDVKHFCADAKIIHIDVDPCSISKTIDVDVPIVGDAKRVLSDMLISVDNEKIFKKQPKKQDWIREINEWKDSHPGYCVQTEKLYPQDVIKAIYEYSKDKDAIIATEVGQHQMWTALLYKFNKPRKFVTSGGLGTMGFGFPAAVGAQVANPDKLVFNIAGDGSIQMNIQELATCVDYNIPVKVCIINNGYLGMVRQWQEKLFNQHYSQTPISSPDYIKLAEAYGAVGIRVTRQDEIMPALKKAEEINGPVFLDFIVEPFENVYPWVLAGKPISAVLMGNDD